MGRDGFDNPKCPPAAVEGREIGWVFPPGLRPSLGLPVKARDGRAKGSSFPAWYIPSPASFLSSLFSPLFNIKIKKSELKVRMLWDHIYSQGDAGVTSGVYRAAGKEAYC